MKESQQNNKQRIIESANQLFYAKGYNQASFADIAKELGLSKGNLHYHFHSKEEILDAVINLRVQIIQNNIATWDKSFAEPKDKLHRFAQILHNESHCLLRFGVFAQTCEACL